MSHSNNTLRVPLLAAAVPPPSNTPQPAAPTTPTLPTNETKTLKATFIESHSFVGSDEWIWLNREQEEIVRRNSWDCTLHCLCTCYKEPDPANSKHMAVLYCGYITARSCQFPPDCPSATWFRTKNCFSLFANTWREMCKTGGAIPAKDLAQFSLGSCNQNVLARYEAEQNGFQKFMETELKPTKRNSTTMTRS
ncbi:hypothetical protein AYO45_06675 [Gammaproteobacteria bacterium SCGC AG-212-F23]|nr:hypothetical protein AYO45_06675 [Gammaproteobacteria bacterium SCGC AG-212-F23]